MPGHRRFYTFLTGSFFASFGGWINLLAILNIATYRFNATPFDLVILSAALLVPPILLTRIISRVCGRYASTRVLVVALTLTLGTTAALLWVGNFIAFLLVVALKSAALGFTDPSETLYVTTCIDEAHQSRAFRLLSLAQSVAKICAPAAGGIVAAWAGDNHTMLASIVLIAVAIVLMLASTSNGKAVPEASTTQDQKAASRAPFSGTVVPLLLCVGIYFALAAAVNNQFPLMLKHQGFDKSVLGIVVSCSALGGVLGSLLPMGRHAKQAGLGALIAPALATSVIFIVMGGIFRLPLRPAEWLLATAFFATGFVGARFRVECRLFIARRLADQVASASASLQSAGMLMQFIAPCIGAVLTSLLTASEVFITLGSVAAASLVAVAFGFGRQQHVAGPVAAALVTDADHR
ncbi:MFS transporter [Paraburkholderia sp. BCC1885]|uniref:MFS transporter n=1 Tax=Paraburkholderia sp. BCC1885 TaxID=2562669 RepID=UPI0016433F98|nr:MFS transporter [Paraburkholderia sp. BCC1885]